MCKLAYKSTNHKEYQQQMLNFLIRQESVFHFRAYLAWRDKNYPEVNEDDDLDNAEADLQDDRVNLQMDDQSWACRTVAEWKAAVVLGNAVSGTVLSFHLEHILIEPLH
jgi:hypothetical protein